MNIEVIRYKLPVYWACALINDDYTGLCKEECQEIKNFLNIADGYPVDVDWETEGFYKVDGVNVYYDQIDEVVYLVKIILEEMEGKDHGESS